MLHLWAGPRPNSRGWCPALAWIIQHSTTAMPSCYHRGLRCGSLLKWDPDLKVRSAAYMIRRQCIWLVIYWRSRHAPNLELQVSKWEYARASVSTDTSINADLPLNLALQSLVIMIMCGSCTSRKSGLQESFLGWWQLQLHHIHSSAYPPILASGDSLKGLG